MNAASILLTTHNRAAILKETLQAMTAVDRRPLEAEWIVVNNNCTDDTDQVVESFRSKLPLRLLHETKPGKNCALNLALRTVPLHPLVVFTDDDTSPAADWLSEIGRASERWPKHAVFGGRIDPRWPGGERPAWIEDQALRSFGFSEHHVSEQEGPYPAGVYPFGPNYWVRKDLFDQGRRFREEMGPIGGSRIMGSETSFLVPLATAGYEMIYCPKVKVEHRIKPGDCADRVLCRRAFSLGRGNAQLGEIHHRQLLERWPAAWHARQALKLAWAYARLLSSYFIISRQLRLVRRCRNYIYLGQTLETTRMARSQPAAPVR